MFADHVGDNGTGNGVESVTGVERDQVSVILVQSPDECSFALSTPLAIGSTLPFDFTPSWDGRSGDL